MPLGLRSGVGPGNHVLDGSPHFPMGRGNFEGRRGAHCKVQGQSAVSCAKTVEPIAIPFELWAQVGPINNVLDEVQIHQ